MKERFDGKRYSRKTFAIVAIAVMLTASGAVYYFRPWETSDSKQSETLVTAGEINQETSSGPNQTNGESKPSEMPQTSNSQSDQTVTPVKELVVSHPILDDEMDLLGLELMGSDEKMLPNAKEILGEPDSIEVYDSEGISGSTEFQKFTYPDIEIIFLGNAEQNVYGIDNYTVSKVGYTGVRGVQIGMSLSDVFALLPSYEGFMEAFKKAESGQRVFLYAMTDPDGDTYDNPHFETNMGATIEREDGLHILTIWDSAAEYRLYFDGEDRLRSINFCYGVIF